MKILLVIMYTVGAILPLLGFLRLLFRASRDLDSAKKLAAVRGGTGGTNADLNELLGDITAAPRKVRRDIFWDILLIGPGLALSAVASIWALG